MTSDSKTQAPQTNEAKNGEEKWQLRLYIAGQSAKSIIAFTNLKKICEAHLQGQYSIEVIDLTVNPQLAKEDRILALPTLIRKIPEPMKRLIGDLSITERVLVKLDIKPFADEMRKVDAKQNKQDESSPPPKDATEPFDLVLEETGKNVYILRLYVTGLSPKSQQAIENVRRICTEHLEGRYQLEIIDIYQQPHRAGERRIITAPTLVKELPLPLVKFIGDMSKIEQILFRLDNQAEEVTPMASADRTREELLSEIKDLRLRLEEAEETLHAIGSGEVDAFVISGPDGQQIFSLEGADHSYRVLVETMNEGAATLTPDGTILYCNTSLAAMLQIPPARLLGTPLASHVASADQPLFASLMQKCTTEADREEISLITAKGNGVPALISFCALDSRMISVVITDITPQKRNEEFMAAEKLARSIIHQAGEVIIVCDEKGKIIRASRLAHQLCGENPLLKPFDQVVRLQEAKTGRLISLLPSMPSEYYQNAEVVFKRRDDTPLSFLLNVSPLKGGRDQLIGFIVILADVTEHKKIREQLLAMNDELERKVEQRTRELQEKQSQYLHTEKLAAIGQLSASIAHEFNNPLQGVMIVLKSLKQMAKLEEEDKELVNAAIDESERMKNLLRSLQEFNRPSSGKKVLMDVHKSIDSLLLLCKSDFKGKRISTVRKYAERLPQIVAISDQIKQVFLNLLNNAADACIQPGGVITITTWQEEKNIAVAIKDTGIGITPEKMDLIFQPFYTTKPEVKGTGLGLSVCHGIIQNHRGEIRVESGTGQGSTFTVLLPVDGESDDA